MAEFKKGLAISPDDTGALALMGRADAASGRRVDAQKVLDQLNEVAKLKYVPAWVIAQVYAALGEKDKAFEELEKSYEERSIGFGSAAIKVSPFWDPVRSDPRFQDLLRRMNLQP